MSDQPPAGTRRFFADYAWIGGPQAADQVLIEVSDGAIAAVSSGAARPDDAVHLRGLALPGMANAHSHAFHRALRGRTHRGGSFWTWREDMYRVAARLTPESYYELARAVYAEMALAGITAVGEFHYLHHDHGGKRYSAVNEFGVALCAAARDVGIRITLLDTCYLTGGIGRPLEGPQLRFGDGDAATWAARAEQLSAGSHVRIGAAIHSVRAVPADQLSTVAGWAAEHDAPLHFHVSEQRAENDACRAAYGRSPVQLLGEHGALSERSCAVHATHLDEADVGALARAHTTVCMCPTTERDLADGIGPARQLLTAGAPLALGSDSHAVIDPLEETRALELDERLRTLTRGNFSAQELLTAATAGGHQSIGWSGAGRIAVGAPADFIAVATGSVRTAGSDPATLLEAVIFAASAADVTDVIVAGETIVSEGRHRLLADVAGELERTIAAVAA